MAIHFIICVTRKNGKIVGLKAEESSSLGGTLTRYWSAKQVYEVHNKEEYEIIGGKTIDKGIYDFVVKSKNGLGSVGVEAEVDGDTYYVTFPKLGDEDLLMNLPECSTVGM